MRYGILEYKNPNCINIGDAMQIVAVMNLYKQMGISQSEIIKINYYDLWTYSGEEVVLPICFPFYGFNSSNKVTCFSGQIKPIFLSLSLFDTNLDDDDVLYLKQYEPIGCRDEFTAMGLAQKGIKTYLNGCMTLTLDIDRIQRERKEIYCIDIPEEFCQYIPKSYRKHIKKATHIYKNIEATTDDYAQKLLEEYADRAKLVITSRMHAAVPCYAIGIPVIFIPQEYSYRFTWLEDILRAYLPSEWNDIDWQGIDIQKNKKALYIKQCMTEIAYNRILNGIKANEKIYELQKIYAYRDKRTYTRGPLELAITYIDAKWDKEKPIKYAVWGVSQVASALIDYIKVNFPLAKLEAVIDAVKTKEFKQCIPQKIEYVENIKDLFVFITADTVNPYAYDFFARIDKSPESSLFCWTHIKEGMVNE